MDQLLDERNSPRVLRMDKASKTCGECARFKVPNSGCDNSYYISEGTMLASDPACENFYPARKTKSKKTRKKLLKDSGYTGSGCFEAIYHNEKPAFLLRNSENFNIAESIEIGEETFFPKEAKNIPYAPYGYFEGQVPSPEDLFWKIKDEFQIFIDLENIWREVLSSCVLLSYQQEKSQTVPYIFLFGDNESGKSTILQLLKLLCYRPMYGVTIPAADIYGYLEDSDSIGCTLEDEVQGIQKDTDKIKIYKAGYKQGAVVPRTVITSFDRIIKYYRVFCFKACASEQIPQVKGFRERFIEISMVEGFPEKEWTDVTKEDFNRLHNLRNVLLKWRMLTREQDLPNVEVGMKGRLKELWKPLLQITHGLTVYNNLSRFVEDLKKERLSVKQDTLEGNIVKVVTSIFNESRDNAPMIPFQTIWTNMTEELGGKIDENKPHAMETSEFFRVTKNKVGYRLREVLCGKSKTIREKDATVKAYEFNLEKLGRIAKKYGFELVTKLPTLPSSKGVQAPAGIEKEVEKYVEKDPHTPVELSNVSNLVTGTSESKLAIKDIALKTAKLERLSGLFPDKCIACSFSGNMGWQLTEHDGSWGLLCENCGFELQKLLGEKQ